MALGLLIVGGYAVAQVVSNLKMKTVTATATVSPTQPPEEVFCTGADGEEYVYIHIVGEGPIVSSDPRLEGTFHADAELLHRVSDGSGISRDHFEVRDSVTGALKMKGRAWATDPSPPSPIKGFAVARLADGSRFWAHSTVTVPPPGVQAPIVIEYGTANPGVADRAEIFSGAGQCAELLLD